MNANDSLIETAVREMKSKRRPRTLAKITKDVFEVKGINPKDAKEQLIQFQMDFMLSGHFICCGEDKRGEKIWDLKSRQVSSLLDKDGTYLDDLYDYDEDIAKYELKDNEDFEDDEDLGDEDEDKFDEDSDDIEEELEDDEDVHIDITDLEADEDDTYDDDDN